jgi:hypothetical protein
MSGPTPERTAREMRRTPKPRSDLSYVLTRRESPRDEHKKAPAGRMGRTPGLLLADCIGAVTSSLPPASDLRPDHVGQGHERDVDDYPHGKEGEGEHHASSFIGRPWPTTRASARSSSVILPHCRSGSREYQLVPWRRSVARPPASLPGMAPLAWPYAERGAAALSKQVGERNAQGAGDLRERRELHVLELVGLQQPHRLRRHPSSISEHLLRPPAGLAQLAHPVAQCRHRLHETIIQHLNHFR